MGEANGPNSFERAGEKNQEDMDREATEATAREMLKKLAEEDETETPEKKEK